MACIVELDTARYYREQTRLSECESIARQLRPDLLSDWLDDMDNRTDQHIELIKLLADDDPEFMDAIMQCERLARLKDSALLDTVKAAVAEKIGKIVRNRADAMVGEKLEDAKYQELAGL